jgi:hypothetical protein
MLQDFRVSANSAVVIFRVNKFGDFGCPLYSSHGVVNRR